jgi:hypothetical protein
MEIAFETLAGAHEATRGTAVTPPTHYLPFTGTIDPTPEWYEPQESRGALFRRYRQEKIRENATWQFEGGADPRYLPFLLSMATGVGVIATPGGGTNALTHTYKPDGTTDTIKTATLYFGDSNVQIWQADFAFLNTLTISADASGSDGVTLTAGGMANAMVEVATPTWPSLNVGQLLLPQTQQLWIDTSSAIGTTEVTGRVISSSFELTNNIAAKPIATGPAGSLSYSRIGRGYPDVVSRFQLEVPDTTQMDQALASTTVKVRNRVSSGSVIEGSLYWFVQWDTYGKLKFDGWGTLADTNRTANFRIDSIYDSTLGADYQVVVQNNSATV